MIVVDASTNLIVPPGRETHMPKHKNFFRTCACCDQPATLASSRRNFLSGGVAALGLGAAGAAGRAAPLLAQAQAPAPAAALAKMRIDVHHHFIPPVHVEARMKPGRRVGPTPKWSPELSLEDMDKSGIATAILSAVQPGVWYGDNVEEARKVGREINEYAARMIKDHPGRFGLFAIISPPDVEGSLKEIEYTLDTLKADGIGLLTSYQDKYLGDAKFAPIYEELNRRKAVFYVHPTTPPCCRGLLPGIPPGSIEYATDSTRTIAHVVFSGTAQSIRTSAGSFRTAAGRCRSSPAASSACGRSASPRSPICPRGRCRNSPNSITSLPRATRPARSPRS